MVGSEKDAPEVSIYRIADDGIATYGVLVVDGRPLCVTLEPPWKANKRNISCIPSGRYRAVRYASSRHGMTFKLMKVHNRSGILFHAGNTAADTDGCVLLGMEYATRHGAQGIRSSRVAMDAFLHQLADVSETTVTIWEAIQ